MLTNLKNWFKGLFKKQAPKVETAVKEAAGWERYHQVMSAMSTALEGSTVLPSAVNDQITDAVTQAKPKKKTSKQTSNKKKPAKMSAEPKKKSTTKKKSND